MPSYQSAGFGWKPVLLAFAVFLVAARPYEDTQKRFLLEVESGWSLAPQFGDASGMVFEKRLPVRQGGGSALFLIRADKSGGRGLDNYIQEIEATFQKIPGFRADGRSATTIAGRPAIKKSYRTKGRRLKSHFFEANGFFYLVHFEAPRIAMSKLWPEASRMLSSFSPGRARARSPVAAPPRRAPASAPVGRWRSKTGIILELEEGGTYSLADVEGTYRIDGEALVLSNPSGGRTTFTFEHDPDAGRLVLRTAALSEPLVYTRATAPPPKGSKQLVGKWRAIGVEPVFELSIDEAGTFVLGPYSGKWAIEDDALRLAKSPTEFITYKFRFRKKRLVLSGGDLDQPIQFKRLSSR